MLYKSFQVELKADEEKRLIEGYASTFGDVDLVGDVVEPGAFTKTIRERMSKGLIKVRYRHTDPIGKPVHLEEDSKGLFTVSKISKTARGDEVLELAKDGVADRMSIGYRVIRWEPENVDGRTITHLKELELREYSITDLAINEDAIITSVKAQSLQDMVRHLPLGIVNEDEFKAWAESIKSQIDSLRGAGEAPTPPNGAPGDSHPPFDMEAFKAELKGLRSDSTWLEAFMFRKADTI